MVFKNYQINGVDASSSDFARLKSEISNGHTYIMAVKVTLYDNNEGVNYNYITNN